MSLESNCPAGITYQSGFEKNQFTEKTETAMYFYMETY